MSRMVRLLIAGDERQAITRSTLSKCWWHMTVQQWSMPKPYIGQKSRFLSQLLGGSIRI